MLNIFGAIFLANLVFILDTFNIFIVYLSLQVKFKVLNVSVVTVLELLFKAVRKKRNINLPPTPNF